MKFSNSIDLIDPKFIISIGMSANRAALKPWLLGQAPSLNLYKNVML